MPLVEELFLANKDAEYTDTYATIMALRFHGTEEKVIPRPRLLQGLRMMLDRPQLADLVIPDLARWEDWSVMDKLVELFKNSNDESSWVRVPVINYLRACPLPAAKVKLDELARLDPESIKRANSFFPLGGAAAPTAAAKPAANEADKKADAQQTPGTPAAADAASGAPSRAPGNGPGAPTPNTGQTKTSQPPAQPKPAPAAGDASNERSTRTQTAAAARAPADDVALPGPPPSSLSVYGGLTAAAVLLACAVWAILNGGQRAAG
jgi:hypothetical protein